MLQSILLFLQWLIHHTFWWVMIGSIAAFCINWWLESRQKRVKKPKSKSKRPMKSVRSAKR